MNTLFCQFLTEQFLMILIQNAYPSNPIHFRRNDKWLPNWGNWQKSDIWHRTQWRQYTSHNLSIYQVRMAAAMIFARKNVIMVSFCLLKHLGQDSSRISLQRTILSKFVVGNSFHRIQYPDSRKLWIHMIFFLTSQYAVPSMFCITKAARFRWNESMFYQRAT